MATDSLRLPPFCAAQIDVQGWELEVLRGLADALRERRVLYVLLEFWPKGMRRHAKADAARQDSDGDAPLHKAAAQGHAPVADALARRCPAAAALRNRKRRTPADVAKSDELRARLAVRDAEGPDEGCG